jgi:hypothetical protein
MPRFDSRRSQLAGPAVALRLSFALAAVVLAAVAVLSASAKTASNSLQVGVTDDAFVLGQPETAFPLLKALRVQVLQMTLPWGGPNGVAQSRPLNARDPADPAYDWSAYDRIVAAAAKEQIELVFTIYGTPPWESGSGALNRAPRRFLDLEAFAYAAAKRYSGSFKLEDGTVLPPVRKWLAWNEPNNPVFLQPQYRRVGRRYVIESAINYAQICAATVTGVHQTKLAGEQVACGATDPNGNNLPASTRPSVSPLVFLQALKRAGLRSFDVYAHHAYPTTPQQTPSTRPHSNAVTLANIDRLVRELSRLYGRKQLWITEYGYQTNPPDRAHGISWAKQARYLTLAYAGARRNPRIDMLLWFLVRDDPRTHGWHSGFVTSAGRKKPSYDAFRRLPHS